MLSKGARKAPTGLLSGQQHGARPNKKHEEAVGALVRDIVAAVNRRSGAIFANPRGAELCAEIMAAVLGVLQTRSAELEYAERKRQAELAKRPRLQTAILEAARHYRDQRKTAGTAWDAIKKAEYSAQRGDIVRIDGPKNERLKQKIFVVSSGGTKKRKGVSFEQWRQSYWRAADS
jgi:hypothetical protein